MDTEAEEKLQESEKPAAAPSRKKTGAKKAAGTAKAAAKPAKTTAAKTTATTTSTPAKSAAAPAKSAAMPDLATLDRDELLQLSRDVEKALKSYEKRRQSEALIEMQKVAEKHGVSLKDLMPQGAGSKKSVSAPKFRHPENPSLTWSGRGRQPTWYKEAVANGLQPEAMRI